MRIGILVSLVLPFMYSAWAYEGQEKTFDVRGAYILTNEHYDLSGSGFTTTVGSSSGTGTAFALNWNRKEANYFLEYLGVKHEVTAPSSLSPSSTTSEFTRYLLIFTPRGSEYSMDGGGLKLNYGVDVRRRMATETSPNQFMSNHDSVGVRFGTGYVFGRGKKTYFDTGAGLFFPLFVDERSDRTGYRKFSINPDAKVALVHNLTDLVVISVGAQVIYEWIFYGGTGHRGTANADETFINFQLPLELRFQF